MTGIAASARASATYNHISILVKKPWPRCLGITSTHFRGAMSAKYHKMSRGKFPLQQNHLGNVVLVDRGSVILSATSCQTRERRTWFTVCTTIGKDPFAARANNGLIFATPWAKTSLSFSILDEMVGVSSPASRLVSRWHRPCDQCVLAFALLSNIDVQSNFVLENGPVQNRSTLTGAQTHADALE